MGTAGVSRKIGFIGLGLMGRPMGMNLLKAGHALTVWNRTPSRAEELVARGRGAGENTARGGAGKEALLTASSATLRLWNPCCGDKKESRMAPWADSRREQFILTRALCLPPW